MNDADMIIEKKCYFNHLGMAVEERVIICGTPGPNFSRFVGVGALEVPVAGPDGELIPQQMPFEFPLPYNTVKEAFTHFRAACTVAGQKHREEIEKAMKEHADNQPRIITPG